MNAYSPLNIGNPIAHLSIMDCGSGLQGEKVYCEQHREQDQEWYFFDIYLTSKNSIRLAKNLFFFNFQYFFTIAVKKINCEQSKQKEAANS